MHISYIYHVYITTWYHVPYHNMIWYHILIQYHLCDTMYVFVSSFDFDMIREV